MRKTRSSWARLSVRIRYRSARTSEEYVIGRLRPFYVFTQTAARIISQRVKTAIKKCPLTVRFSVEVERKICYLSRQIKGEV